MKNTFGQSVCLTLFGESHGPAVGAVIDGLAPGLEIDENRIAVALSRRAPRGMLETERREPDEFQILSGMFRGKTTGTPLCIVIPNKDCRSGDYPCGIARPSHGDYAAFCKFHGYEDYRGGGHMSGRVTAAVVAAGAVFLSALQNLDIQIGTHILRCGNAKDRTFEDLSADLAYLQSAEFPILDAEREAAGLKEIAAAKEKKDSIGGITETAVLGAPAGLGEPWFDSMESLLSHALFGIGGIKGISFGDAFDAVCTRGSLYNDPFRIRQGEIVTATNHSGGINAGITNGMPLMFRCAVKPTPSIGLKQDTVDFNRRVETELTLAGRHDPSILRRVCPVIDSITAFVLCDVLASRFGTDYLAKGRRNQ